MVWKPANWQRLRKLPADLNPTDAKDAEGGPPSQIDVYTGGNIKWADVIVPKGLQIVDQRLEAHGFTPADGIGLAGTRTDLGTQKPKPGKGQSYRRRAQTQGAPAATPRASAQN